MSTLNNKNELIACKHCDSLASVPILNSGESALCPCCGRTLYSRKVDSVNRTLAVSLAGLMLLVPAFTTPIIGVSVAGKYNDATLIDCIMLMINADFYIIAFCVFLFAIAIPSIRIFSAFYLSYKIKCKQLGPSLLTFYRSYHLFDSWTMVHVFFLGVIVSMYKLITLDELSVGSGLISLLLLLFCSTLISITLDQRLIWDLLEEELESQS
ncbi:paraquat-inducible protein A [Thalassotalea sp. SU-HH00458]|uniref:paraquat-inducible protein A n=1 Tax=Thalassotalea sp. SU-HH00458 TaxID=3127657 RepID=UPI00336534EC